jgi:hypothetical protein
MALKRDNIPLLGSFKRGIFLPAESPLEALWDEIERMGTEGALGRQSSEVPGVDWPRHRQYAMVRIAQALELRRSAARASVLTRPLALYYSFLNLLRAFMAIGPEVLSWKGHGLVYRFADLFESAATLAKAGTFRDYLKARSIPAGPPFRLTLMDCFERIPEMARPLVESGRETRMIPVTVKALYSGQIMLHFRAQFMPDKSAFDGWQGDYPSLAPECERVDTSLTLRAKPQGGTDPEADVSVFCDRHLLPDLLTPTRPTWFASRLGPEMRLPREAYYFVAMYILSNLVRYEPEQLHAVSGVGSESGWLIRKFLTMAERLFPQLLISWVWGRPLYVHHP